MLELPGSITSELTARLAISSSRGVQEVPELVVFQTPPAIPAAYIVAGVDGSMRIRRVLPPMLPGPSDVQVESASGGGGAGGGGRSGGPAPSASSIEGDDWRVRVE